MRVLVAGDGGYIGTVLVPFLRAAGHVADGPEGCDLGPAPGDASAKPPQNIRNVTTGQRAGYHELTSARFVRLRRVRELLVGGTLDEMLRRNNGHPAPDGPAIARG